MDRLVIIDDDVEYSRFVANVAEGIGYVVKAASHAQDFKDLVEQWSPTVILIDLALPDIDGLALLRWLASQNCRTPIMIMSGFDGRVIDAAKRIGEERGLMIHCALTKPIRAHDMQEKLEQLKKASVASRHGDFELSATLDHDDLKRGLEAEELFLVYQPKIHLKTGTIHGVEALARWAHPKHGTILPDQFISLAEETGLIDKLTDSVLREAIHQQKIWQQQGLNIQVAANLSAINLENDQLPNFIEAQCKAEDVSIHRLLLEVTESVAMSNALEALDLLTRLRLKGAELSIDDFGTGFSSMTRIRRLPVTEIKIDKSFVIDAIASKDAYTIVKAITNLAHSMDLVVVAEGIETAEHYKMLTELGCHLGQGYGIARPMPAEKVIAWSEKWQQDHVHSKER